MYRTLVFWTDLLDGDHPYHPGDEYPREGLKPTKKRILELSTNKNRRGVPLIEEVNRPKSEE